MTLKNTENLALVKIKNIQSTGSDEQETELITEGKFYRSGEKLYIFYQEEESEETASSTVMIIIDKDKVTVSRKGDFGSKMNYKEGESEDIIYHTPYGNMVFGLKTLSLRNNMTDEGGELNIIYNLSLDGEVIGNDLSVTVKVGRDEKDD